jgi:adenylate kinase
LNILLFGAPGSGKGTQSALLVETLGYLHISSGDLFRSAIKNQTPLGVKAKTLIDKGELVPDSLTIDLIKEVLLQKKGQKFILDGFPRNIVQANALEVLLKDLKATLDKAIFLEVPKEQLKKRLVGRRVCKNCGVTYHVDSQPPRKAGICDVCGGEVVQRADDKEDVIDNRLMVYENNTAPLKDYYAGKNLLKPIDGLGSQDEIFVRIEDELKN